MSGEQFEQTYVFKDGQDDISLGNVLSVVKSLRSMATSGVKMLRDKRRPEDQCGGWISDESNDLYLRLRFWLHREFGVVKAEMHVSMQVVWTLARAEC